MFDLKFASTGLRKAAALKGIKRGKYSPIHDTSDTPAAGAIVAKVFNSHNPDGIVIRFCDVEQADNYTWNEINAS